MYKHTEDILRITEQQVFLFMCYHFFGCESFLFQFIKLVKCLLIIDDLSHGNNKQSGWVQIHDRVKKLVESMMNEFLLIFSSITAGKLKLGRAVA